MSGVASSVGMDHPMSLTLRLGGRISVADFAESADLWSKVLAAVTEESAAGQEIEWVISDLNYSSAIVTAEALTTDEQAARFVPRVVDGYLEAARDVHRGVSDPARPSLGVVRQLVENASPVADITFETPQAEVTFDMAPDLQPLEPPPESRPASLGTIRGRVETLSHRGGLRFTLYDLVTDRAVSCYVEPGGEDQLRDIWGKLADVTGLVSRDARTERPVSVRKVSAITPVAEPRPGAFEAALGVVDFREGGGRSEDLIRRIRDAG